QRAEAVAQTVQQEMLRQLRDMSEAIRNPRSLDWNPVTFKVTEETPEGPPAVGFGLSLARTGEEPAKTIRRTSDASGIVDFGAVQPGDYTFEISKGWENGYQSTSGQLNVLPGSRLNRLVVCPRIPPELASVRVRCTWPSDLEKEGLVLYAP